MKIVLEASDIQRIVENYIVDENLLGLAEQSFTLTFTPTDIPIELTVNTQTTGVTESETETSVVEEAPKKKRKRRTKAEMEAAKAAEAQDKDAADTSEDTEVSEAKDFGSTLASHFQQDSEETTSVTESAQVASEDTDIPAHELEEASSLLGETNADNNPKSLFAS